VGEVLVVLISDGRANVPLSASDRMREESEDEPAMDKKALAEEVLNTSKMLGQMKSFKVLVMDTENKFVSTGFAKEIANASMGKYHYIPNAKDSTVAAIAGNAIANMKSS
jgi:magnesium chelatase subunit D